jgi:hypothetical protein
MKDNLKIAAVILVVLIGVPYLSSAIQTKQVVDEISTRADNPTSEPVINISKGRADFMSGCDTGEYDGAGFDQTAYCGCVFDTMLEEKGINWIVKLGLNVDTTEAEAAMEPYANRCVNNQQILTN